MVGLFDPAEAVPACAQHASEAVVGDVAEAVGDSAGGFEDAIDRFGRGPVGRAEGIEVGQDCRLPRCLSVRPRRGTSGIGQVGNEEITSLTSSLPRSGLAWWMFRSFSYHCQATVTSWSGSPRMSFASSPGGLFVGSGKSSPTENGPVHGPARRTKLGSRRLAPQPLFYPIFVHASQLFDSNTSPFARVTVAAPWTMLLSLMLASLPVPVFHA